jgi:hypothetical protein
VLELVIEHRLSPNGVTTIGGGAATLTESIIAEPEQLLRNADRAIAGYRRSYGRLLCRREYPWMNTHPVMDRRSLNGMTEDW